MDDRTYVHKETGRIVVDLGTLEEGDSVDNYDTYEPAEFKEYLISKRRELDAYKEQALLEDEEFRIQEEARVNNLATVLQSQLGISEEDARSLIQPAQPPAHNSFGVSEKVFGAVILPEEEE